MASGSSFSIYPKFWPTNSQNKIWYVLFVSSLFNQRFTFTFTFDCGYSTPDFVYVPSAYINACAYIYLQFGSHIVSYCCLFFFSAGSRSSRINPPNPSPLPFEATTGPSNAWIANRSLAALVWGGWQEPMWSKTGRGDMELAKGFDFQLYQKVFITTITQFIAVCKI